MIYFQPEHFFPVKDQLFKPTEVITEKGGSLFVLSFCVYINNSAFAYGSVQTKILKMLFFQDKFTSLFDPLSPVRCLKLHSNCCLQEAGDGPMCLTFLFLF